MKKRMLLIFAFGLSFGSPVIAAAPGEQIIGPNKTGELSISSIDMRGAQCNRREKKPSLVMIAAGKAERHEETSGRSGAGAASARAN